MTADHMIGPAGGRGERMLSEAELQMILNALADADTEEEGPSPQGLAEEIADGELRLTVRATDEGGGALPQLTDHYIVWTQFGTITPMSWLDTESMGVWAKLSGRARIVKTFAGLLMVSAALKIVSTETQAQAARALAMACSEDSPHRSNQKALFLQARELVAEDPSTAVGRWLPEFGTIRGGTEPAMRVIRGVNIEAIRQGLVMLADIAYERGEVSGRDAYSALSEAILTATVPERGPWTDSEVAQ